MVKSATPKTFEEALQRLEELAYTMQNTQIPLEETLNNYEEGKKLVLFCRKKLADFEQKLQKLDEDGKLVDFTLDDNENNKSTSVSSRASKSSKVKANTDLDNGDLLF